MKQLFLCGVFANENKEEIINKTKTNVEFSANLFQLKMINGFKKNGTDIEVVSAPFIGAYPKSYKQSYFKGFDSKTMDDFKYIHFNNFWGIRNFSRKNNCFKALKSFINSTDEEKIIYVYSVHTPFLQAAIKAKQKDKRIKICLIVPDLPEYMNLGKKNTGL